MRCDLTMHSITLDMTKVRDWVIVRAHLCLR